MHQQSLRTEIAPAALAPYLRAAEIRTARLGDEDKSEVLQFLAQRPLHTVTIVGFIRDNGLVSPLNRGDFYGCRNRKGELEGVAIIGHATLMETTTDRAVEALAEIARKCKTAHLIMGEKQRVDEFLNYYSDGGQEMRLAGRELLFELRWPIEAHHGISGLRRATIEDLDLVLPVHAELAFAESGVNPLEKDPEGFRERGARRIEQGRTWVLIDRKGELTFKAEVVAENSDVTYLEGIWVNPNARREGVGRRCMFQLAQNLLAHSASLCLLVNDKNVAAQNLYKKLGYKIRGAYDTIFLK
ncbi:MAG TPA: GNAT family N-acetyltransferase [Pyrinomonadaceae bacterium]|nr:GNAT family N-acetyltransferase [Pyrinomonadaceae bacterium]